MRTRCFVNTAAGRAEGDFLLIVLDDADGHRCRCRQRGISRIAAADRVREQALVRVGFDQGVIDGNNIDDDTGVPVAGVQHHVHRVRRIAIDDQLRTAEADRDIHRRGGLTAEGDRVTVIDAAFGDCSATTALGDDHGGRFVVGDADDMRARCRGWAADRAETQTEIFGAFGNRIIDDGDADRLRGAIDGTQREVQRRRSHGVVRRRGRARCLRDRHRDCSRQSGYAGAIGDDGQ